MIEVLISPQCMAIMRALRIPPTLVQETVNERDTGCVSDGLDRMIAARWLNEESLILVDSLVSKRTVEHEFTHVRFDQVTAQLAIVLSSNLPAGTVDRQMTMEQILSVVAASFGRPVRCHPAEPYAALYAGRWSGGAVAIQIGERDSSSLYVCGSFDSQALTCELVWALDLNRYQQFFVRPLLTHSKITVADLTLIAKSFPIQFPSITPSSEALQFFLAATILRAFLGDSWCDQQLTGDTGAHARFQQLGGSRDQMKAQARTVALAEMVFNLQDVPGFAGRLKRLPLADLESAVAELEAARLLLMSGHPFEFIDETQTKGSDYEAHVRMPRGSIACCEVKSKTDKTALSQNTIVDSLKKAAKQMPATRPGIIFLRIPQTWPTQSKKLKETVDRAIDQFFRNYQRIITVVVFWEEWHPQGRALLRFAKYQERVNTASRFYSVENTPLILSHGENVFVNQWRHLSEIVAGARPES